MDLLQAVDDYKKLEEFFAPHYGRDNNVLSRFKEDSPNLSEEENEGLINILQNSADEKGKFFVADLLCLYDSFPIKLLDLLLQNAVDYADLNLNRIFLRPAVKAFGATIVSERLALLFLIGDRIRKMRIAALVYWIEKWDSATIEKLEEVIAERAEHTDNIIELYYYNRYLPDRVKIKRQIPNNANELISTINGNAELEDIVYNGLGWARPNAG